MDKLLPLNIIKKRIKEEGETAELLCQLSRYYGVKKKDSQKALEYAEKAISEDEKCGYAYYRKGASLYSLNQYKEVPENMLKAESLGYIDCELYGILSHSLSKENDFEQALVYANKAISLNEEYGTGYYVKGVAEYKLNDTENALKSFMQAEKSGFHKENMYFIIVCILNNKKDYKQELEFLTKGIKHNPKSGFLYMCQGCLYYETDEHNKAIKSLLKSEKLGYNSYEAYIRLSHLFYMKKDYDKSLEYADRAILANPKEGYPHFRKGRVYYNFEDYEKAKKSFLRAEELGYEDDELFSKLSYIFSKEAEYSKSLKYANKAILLDTNYGFNHYRKGYALFYKEKFKEAKESYLKAKELGYDFYGMNFHLAGIYYLESDFVTALSYINKAIMKKQNDIDYYSLKAQILLSLGRQKEADKCFAKINNLPDSKQ